MYYLAICISMIMKMKN